MLKEHERIMKLLDIFENDISNMSLARNSFNRLKWNLDKHFFVEEKVIFTVFEKESDLDNNDMMRLLKEHKDIYWLLERIEDDLENGIRPKLERFKKLLKEHAGFEDSFFYKKLDEELNAEQRSMIIDRADEIIRG